MHTVNTEHNRSIINFIIVHMLEFISLSRDFFSNDKHRTAVLNTLSSHTALATSENTSQGLYLFVYIDVHKDIK